MYRVVDVVNYLVSAKLEGKSTVIAPPKSSVLVKAIFGNCVIQVRS